MEDAVAETFKGLKTADEVRESIRVGVIENQIILQNIRPQGREADEAKTSEARRYYDEVRECFPPGIQRLPHSEFIAYLRGLQIAEITMEQMATRGDHACAN